MRIPIKIVKTEVWRVEDEDRKIVWGQTRNISVPLRIVFLSFSFNSVWSVSFLLVETLNYFSIHEYSSISWNQKAIWNDSKIKPKKKKKGTLYSSWLWTVSLIKTIDSYFQTSNSLPLPPLHPSIVANVLLIGSAITVSHFAFFLN